MNYLILFIILMAVFAILLIVLPLRKIIKVLEFKANREEYTVLNANLIEEKRFARTNNLRIYYIYRGLYGFTDNEGNTHQFYGPFSSHSVENEIETYYINKGRFKFYTKHYIESVGSSFLILFLGIIVILLMALALYLS